MNYFGSYAQVRNYYQILPARKTENLSFSERKAKAKTVTALLIVSLRAKNSAEILNLL